MGRINLWKNKSRIILLSLLVISFLSGWSKRIYFPPLSPEKDYSIYFSPQDCLYPHLLSLIEEAKESIYAAFYKIELSEVASGLIKAYQRGLEVKVLIDDLACESKDSQYPYLCKFGIIKKDKEKESFMHHKFCIIDKKIVWTGSFNPTPRGVKENNNVIIIKSVNLALEFIEEFEKLWDEKTSGESEEKENLPVSIDETGIEVYFSPEDDCEEAILKELMKAKESIHFALFSFTSPRIASCLIHKYAENVEVKGIMERDQDGPFSQYQYFKRLRMNVKWDGNFYFMHHKFFILDGRVVITGSFNPTYHARYKNRENLLIIHNPTIAKKYEEEFVRMWRRGR